MMTRRSLLAGLAAAPAIRRRRKGRNAMPWGNNIFPLLIVTSGGGFTGLFVYSPGPGANNLIASTAAQAGTDPYGNHYLAGETTYNNAAGFAINQSGNLITFYG